VEDLAIGYGYENFEFTMPKVLTFGAKMELTQFCSKMRNIMIGLGFQEVDTLIMTKGSGSDLTKIMNPLSEEYDSLRTSIVPSLLEILRTNKRHDLPQMIFQIGDVVEGSRSRKKLCAVIIHSKASFTEAKSYAESILGSLKHEVKGTKHPNFISGRCAAIYSDEASIGLFGELHPKIITQYELSYPIIALEFDIQQLIPIIK
jgi:phenylalanyl-tRNA synthetase beta chain